VSEENRQMYYYHGDQLGSAQLITDYRGETYEQLEYTPYGELWVEHEELPTGATPFRFTGKERDGETGLYYYGARYLNPQTSMWLSADPAMGEYIPQAPINDDIRKQNQNLPGMGGVFNYVNLHAYHYAGNNPVKLTDPDGRDVLLPVSIRKEETKNNQLDLAAIALGTKITFSQKQWAKKFGKQFSDTACAATALMNIVSSLYTLQTGKRVTMEQGEQAIQDAIDANAISSVNAAIQDWQNAANAMMQSLGVSGTLTYIGDQEGNIGPCDFVILMWDKTSYDHFVNSREHLYVDTYNRFIGNKSDLKLNEARPVRVFRFEENG
jgi:RHS repeat-associated protein